MGILEGKAAVVTGGGRGIGRGHCLHLAREGARVVVNDVDGAEAEKVAGEIAREGGRAVASADDVGTREGARALIERCASEFGSVDAVVNNAGIVRDRTFLKMSDEEFDDVWRIHVKGTFWCSQFAATRMKDRGLGGAIVNTTSGAHMGNFGQTNYSAAKGAIASMTYTWALELARYGIRVNCIAPRATTRMTSQLPGREGQPAPFLDPVLNGPLVAWLCSDEADWVTGQVFGTGSDVIILMQQPSYGDTAHRDGGWTVEAIRRTFRDGIGRRLQPFGLQKRPYPFYGGVKPEAGERRGGAP
jgi:3-oxoacyl-[acyl-carrier protein] reductase